MPAGRVDADLFCEGCLKLHALPSNQLAREEKDESTPMRIRWLVYYPCPPHAGFVFLDRLPDRASKDLDGFRGISVNLAEIRQAVVRKVRDRPLSTVEESIEVVDYASDSMFVLLHILDRRPVGEATTEHLEESGLHVSGHEITAYTTGVSQSSSAVMPPSSQVHTIF